MARFDRTIPPGGEGTITLEVKTKGYQGEFHKTARVFTNDPKNPRVTIGMKGNVRGYISINPSVVHLVGVLGEEIEKVVHVRGEKKEPLIVKLASVSIPDKVEAKFHEVERGRSYRLKVRNRVDEETTYGGLVKLTTNYSEKPEIVIRVYGRVRPLLQVRPTTLSFGRMSEEQLQQLKSNGRHISRPVIVLLNKGNDLEIQKVELKKSLFEVATMENRGDRMIQLLVEPVLEKLKKGLNADCLKIYTNQKDHKVLEVVVHLEIW